MEIIVNPCFHSLPSLLSLSCSSSYLIADAAKSLVSCLTLWDPMDCSSPVYSVRGFLQARILEWIPMPSSRGYSRPGIEPASLRSPALVGRVFTTSTTWEALPTSLLLSLLLSRFSRVRLWRPHGLQPTRLLHPRDFPGKSTGAGCHCLLWYTAAKSLQSCPTLCNPIDSSPPGSPVPGIFQARVLEWLAIEPHYLCLIFVSLCCAPVSSQTFKYWSFLFRGLRIVSSLHIR